MKQTFTKTLFLFALVMAKNGISQWTDVSNNQINWEVQVLADYYGGGDDGIFDPVADPTVINDLYVDGWLGESCHTYDGYPPIYNYDNGNWYTGTYYNFYTTFATWRRAWESDNSDECTYTEGDDEYYSGYGILRDGATAMRFTYPSTDFYPSNWNSYLGNGGSQWLYNQIYDQQLQMCWRYYFGGNFDNCLNFDDITGTTKYDVNSNRQVAGANTYLSYANQTGNTSADVWYSFYVSSTSQVTISTDTWHTNFDTYLRLFDTAGNQLAVDDDGGSTGNTSMLSIQLCTGTYKFCVEGYSDLTGVFQVAVSASPSPALSISAANVGQVVCETDNTGYASWNVYNNVGPFYVYLNSSFLGEVNSISDLPAGSYTLEVYDQCNSYASNTFSIISNDDAAPTALCADNFSVTAYPDDSWDITAQDIDDGSYDNCGIQSMTISESNFTVSEPGANIVTLTVSDESGNVSTCATTVNVQVGVGIEKELSLTHFEIIPNPNNGNFKLTLNSEAMFRDTYYTIFDLTGRVITKSQLNSATEEISLDDSAPGAFFISIEHKDVKTTERFIVE